MMGVAPHVFRETLSHYPTGVCLVTGLCAQGTPTGMIVGSFTSVSLDPPLVAFYPQKASRSWQQLSHAGVFCVNVLAHDQEAFCRDFSTRSGEKFADISLETSPGGMPVVAGAIATIDCAVHAVHEAGDHLIVLGEVRHLAVIRSDPPMIFCRGGYGAFS